MTRRVLALLVVAVAAAGPLTVSASAADCGRVPDSIGSQLPYPASAVYWRLCGP